MADDDQNDEPSGAERLFGDFAPALVHFTDDVLFGEAWKRPQLSAKERSLVTVAALTAGGNTEQLVFHLQFAKDNGREEIKFLMGDYPADVKAGSEAGSIYGTVNQDPYPQGTTAVDMACLVLTGRQAEVPTPNVYLPLPIVTAENVAEYPPAWGG